MVDAQPDSPTQSAVPPAITDPTLPATQTSEAGTSTVATPDGPPATCPTPICPTPTHGRLYDIAGLALTALEWSGVVGAATGPTGLALAVLALWRRRRRGRSTHVFTSPPSAQRPPEVPPPDTPRREEQSKDAGAPFPRELDEARELLRLRQREGRVAALDALRGMVVDDELDRLAAAGQRDVAESLRQALNERVQAIAPVASGE